MTRTKLVFLFFLVLGLFWFIPVFAQRNDQMFMFEVDGNSYIRKSYNNKGELLNSQLFRVGKVVKKNTTLAMFLSVYNYDKYGTLLDSSITNYTCKPSEKVLLLTVFSFGASKKSQRVGLKLISGNELYPDTWTVGGEMPEFRIELDFNGGILGALGTSSIIDIINRRISAYSSDTNSYSIISKLQIKSYMFAIRLSKLEYTVEERVHPQKGIISQYFRSSSGEYFTVNLQN